MFLLLNTVVKIFAAFCILPSVNVSVCGYKINLLLEKAGTCGKEYN
jgi:hypothetical protein